MKMKARLTLRQLKDFVHLGCSEEERALPQQVEMNIEIVFKEIPPACQSDQLGETVCYAAVAKVLRERLASQHFQTIEHLGHRCFKDLLLLLRGGDELRFQLVKLNPPLAMVNGGAAFELSGVCELNPKLHPRET